LRVFWPESAPIAGDYNAPYMGSTLTLGVIEMAEEHDTLDAGYHDIPSSEKLKAMSFSKLAIKLQEFKPGSAAFLIVEREMNLKADPSLWVNRWFAWGVSLITTAAIGVVLLWLKHAFFP